MNILIQEYERRRDDVMWLRIISTTHTLQLTLEHRRQIDAKVATESQETRDSKKREAEDTCRKHLLLFTNSTKCLQTFKRF